MSDAAKRRATYEDLAEVPPHLVAQIVDGELITYPRPSARHARVTSRLGMEVGNPFDRGQGGPGGWIILDEPELHLEGDVLVPDLAGWRRERMPELPDAAAFELAPQWVCEVLSLSTRSLDRVAKMNIYAREGVEQVWLIDPEARLLEVFRLSAGQWLRVNSWTGEGGVRAEPFQAIELSLASLWER